MKAISRYASRDRPLPSFPPRRLPLWQRRGDPLPLSTSPPPSLPLFLLSLARRSLGSAAMIPGVSRLALRPPLSPPASACALVPPPLALTGASRETEAVESRACRDHRQPRERRASEKRRGKKRAQESEKGRGREKRGHEGGGRQSSAEKRVAGRHKRIAERVRGRGGRGGRRRRAKRVAREAARLTARLRGTGSKELWTKQAAAESRGTGGRKGAAVDSRAPRMGHGSAKRSKESKWETKKSADGEEKEKGKARGEGRETRSERRGAGDKGRERWAIKLCGALFPVKAPKAGASDKPSWDLRPSVRPSVHSRSLAHSRVVELEPGRQRHASARRPFGPMLKTCLPPPPPPASCGRFRSFRASIPFPAIRPITYLGPPG